MDRAARSLRLWLLLATIVLLAPAIPSASAAGGVDVWWPVEGAEVTGVQPFKGMIQSRSVENYTMTWEVDNGQPVSMWNSYDGYPHKEATVDLAAWTWKGRGPYLVTFRAKDTQGVEIAQASVKITNPKASQAAVSTTAVVATSTTPASASPAPVAVPATSTVTNEKPPQVRAVATGTTPAVVPSVATPEVWWPIDGVQFAGTQPFKAALSGRQPDTYQMFWQVDDGGLVPMATSFTDGPHKEAFADVTNWSWKEKGPYVLNFVAKDMSGKVLGEKKVAVSIGPFKMPGTVQTEPAASAPTPSVSTPSASSTLELKTWVHPDFYVELNSNANIQAAKWRIAKPYEAGLMDTIAAQPVAIWLGGWNKDVMADVSSTVQKAAEQGKTAVFIAYNIPGRDCGSYSAGGATTTANYGNWIKSVAAGIGSRAATVVLEPDALPGMDCLSWADREARISMLTDAVAVLKAKPNVRVYIDAGHPGWLDSNEIANRLKSAGLAQADGFSLNVSNFTDTAHNVAYGTKISAATGGKHFVIDTSRNGQGSNGEWCNPWGRGLGKKPTTKTGNPLVDAFLWLKSPGESDGWCNGGGSAGTWWPEYAIGLAERAAY